MKLLAEVKTYGADTATLSLDDDGDMIIDTDNGGQWAIQKDSIDEFIEALIFIRQTGENVE